MIVSRFNNMLLLLFCVLVTLRTATTTCVPERTHPVLSALPNPLHERSHITLTCTEDSCNPPPSLTWIGMCGTSRNITYTYPYYTKISHSTRITSITRDAHRQTCSCLANHTQDGWWRETSISFDVTFGPDFGTSKTTPAVVDGKISQTSGSNITATCASSESNPPSIVSWYIGTYSWSHREELVDSRYISEGPIYAGPHNGTNVTGTYTGPALASQDGKVLKCYAKNPASSKSRLILKATLDINYPPSSAPSIQLYFSGLAISEQSSQRLDCVSKTAKPPASLTWVGFCGVNTNVTKPPSRTAAGSNNFRITLPITRQFHGKTCSCVARHEQTDWMMDSSVTFKVIFGPDSLTMTSQPPVVRGEIRAREQEVVTIVCAAAETFDRPVFKWQLNGVTMPGVPSSEVIGPNGGYLISQTLTLTMTTDKNNQSVVCNVFNNDISTRSPRQSRTATLRMFPMMTNIPTTGATNARPQANNQSGLTMGILIGFASSIGLGLITAIVICILKRRSHLIIGCKESSRKYEEGKVPNWETGSGTGDRKESRHSTAVLY